MRCASGGLAGDFDTVEPYTTHQVKVRVEGIDKGSFFLTAFDARDLAPDGQRPLPGRSPVAEVRVEARPSLEMTLSLPVGNFLVMAAVDPASQGIQAPVGPPRMGQSDVEVTGSGAESVTVTVP